MASWLKVAEDLFEVVDRRAKLVANELSEEQPEFQTSESKGKETQSTRSREKDKIWTRRSSTNLPKLISSGQDQDTAEPSVPDVTNNENLATISDGNASSEPKDLHLESAFHSSHNQVSLRDSSSMVLANDEERDISNDGTAISESSIVATATDDVKSVVSKYENEKSHSPVLLVEEALAGDYSTIIGLDANPETTDPHVKIDEEKINPQRMDVFGSTSLQANDAGTASEPLHNSNKHNAHKDDSSSARVQEQLDEAQGLLKTTVSTGHSKEARLAKVCAGLSSRLQEYKSENAQLEELLVAEKELSTSYQARIKQLERELSTSIAKISRVESSMTDALSAKNSEIETLTHLLDSLKKQAAISEGKLSSLQENMDIVLRSRELTETRIMQALREELATAERRAEEERTAHNATKMAAVAREVELEHRALEAANALARIQRSADESTSRAMELDHKVALLEAECASLNQELQDMEAHARRCQRKSFEEANQLVQIQAWQEEAERARQSQRDAERKISSLEAEMQKMRVEMAGMTRDAEHYSRHEHIELEKRYRELTDLLYHKQTQLEAMTSEKSAAEFQLEKEVRRLQEAQLEAERNRSSRRASSSWEEESDLKVLEPLPLHHRHMTGASKQLEKAAKLLDSGAVRATRFLWRYPYARVVFVFYLVFVHLFLMYLLHRLQEQADTISSSEVASSMGLNNSSLP